MVLYENIFRKRIIYLSTPVLIVLACFFEIDVKISNQSMSYLNKTSFNNPYQHCELCNMNIIDRNAKANSSPRDVILSISFGKIMSIFPFARALRTAGCRARIIIFVDDAAKKKYDLLFYQKLKDCGVELIQPNIRHDYNDPTFQRYEVFMDYLLLHRSEIDRVITVDIFDTCAQSDPFTTDFRKDQLFLQPEGSILNSDPYNEDWIQCSYDNYKSLGIKSDVKIDLKTLKNNEIVNGGEQAGGIDEMIKFLDMILKTNNICQDQGFINFYYYSGLMKTEFKINVTPLQHGNNLFSAIGILAFSGIFDVSNTTSLGSVYVGDKLPSLIHQFDRSSNFASLIKNACPNYDPPFPDYIRC